MSKNYRLGSNQQYYGENGEKYQQSTIKKNVRGISMYAAQKIQNDRAKIT